jgi:hypothetical protein
MTRAGGRLFKPALESLDVIEPRDVDDAEALGLDRLSQEPTSRAKSTRRRPAVHTSETDDDVPDLSWQAHRGDEMGSSREHHCAYAGYKKDGKSRGLMLTLPLPPTITPLVSARPQRRGFEHVQTQTAAVISCLIFDAHPTSPGHRSCTCRRSFSGKSCTLPRWQAIEFLALVLKKHAG